MKDVNIENFKRAETHRYMQVFMKTCKMTNTFYHYRNFDNGNAVVRMNVDTLYSIAIIDTTCGETSLYIPAIRSRYFSITLIDEDHYETFFSATSGVYNFPLCNSYKVCIVRILIKDLKHQEFAKVHRIQDNMKILGCRSRRLNLPQWDVATLVYTTKLLSQLAKRLKNTSSIGMFGRKGEVDELKHLIGTLTGWGGLNFKHAIYESIIPKHNDGTCEFTLNVKKVPVTAFWSITVYNQDGFLLTGEHVQRNAINNYNANKRKNDFVVINFSNDNTKENNINICKHWNYTIRLYGPHDEIIKNKWKFPSLSVVTQ